MQMIIIVIEKNHKKSNEDKITINAEMKLLEKPKNVLVEKIDIQETIFLNH